jgi:hypothetical protein
MENEVSQYGQLNFNLPHDIVKLPSNGVFYKNKKKSIKVGYLTASDENVLLNFRTNKEGVILSLLRNKIYEPDLSPNDLLNGDVEAILIFLRNTAFGPEYTINITDPATGKRFEHTFILDELNIKKTNVQPDENGLFTTKLPKTGREVKLRLFSIGDSFELDKQLDNYPIGLVPPKVTLKLQKQIVSVDGDDDRLKISQFVETLPIMDSKYIRNFLNENEPSLDLTREVIAPSGEKVIVDITFGVEFFRPFF